MQERAKRECLHESCSAQKERKNRQPVAVEVGQTEDSNDESGDVGC